MYKSPVKKGILALLLVSSLCCFNAAAQPAKTLTDSLCIHFAGSPQELHIELIDNISINGTVPLTLCNLEQGRTYGFIAGGWGLEQRRGYLSIGAEGTPRVRGNRIGSLARNATVPGWGSYHSGRGATGWTDLISLATAGYKLVRGQGEYRNMENRLADLEKALNDAGTAPERQIIRARAWAASRELNVQNRHRKRVVAFSSYLYAFQLIDPWLLGNPPAALIEAGGTVVRVEGASSSRAKAMAVSVLRPGRGQFYQGKHGRGVFFSLVTTAAGLYALDKHNHCDVAANEYETNAARFDAAETIEEKERYRDRAPALWNDVKEAKRDRNIGYGVLAAVWISGVIDALFPGREDAFPLNLAFDIGPTRASLVYRF